MLDHYLPKDSVVFDSGHSDFKNLIEAMLPQLSSGSNMSLFWSVCSEYIDRIGDDDLFFELQDLYEKLNEKGLEQNG